MSATTHVPTTGGTRERTPQRIAASAVSLGATVAALANLALYGLARAADVDFTVRMSDSDSWSTSPQPKSRLRRSSRCLLAPAPPGLRTGVRHDWSAGLRGGNRRRGQQRRRAAVGHRRRRHGEAAAGTDAPDGWRRVLLLDTPALIARTAAVATTAAGHARQTPPTRGFPWRLKRPLRSFRRPAGSSTRRGSPCAGFWPATQAILGPATPASCGRGCALLRRLASCPSLAPYPPRRPPGKPVSERPAKRAHVRSARQSASPLPGGTGRSSPSTR